MLFPPERRHCLGRYGEAAGFSSFPGGFAVNALTSAFTQFVPSRDVRVYACGVGPRFSQHDPVRQPQRHIGIFSFGALRQGRWLNPFSGGFAVMSHIASRDGQPGS